MRPGRPRIDRPRFGGGLTVLVTVPLIVMLAMAAGIAVNDGEQAGRAAATVASVAMGSEIGGIVADLQQERLVSVGYLLGTADVSALAPRTAAVGDDITNAESELGTRLPGRLRAALDHVGTLDPLRDSVVARTTTSDAIVTGFGAVIGAILDATRLVDGLDTSTEAGRQVVALDALLRIDELSTASAALLVAASGTSTEQTIVGYAADQAAIGQLRARFTGYATPRQVALYRLVTDAYTQRTGPNFAEQFAAAPAATIARFSPEVLYPQMTSYVVLGRFVEKEIAATVTSAMVSQRDRDLLIAYGTVSLAVLAVLIVAFLGVRIARRQNALVDLLDRTRERGPAETTAMSAPVTSAVERVDTDVAGVRVDPVTVDTDERAAPGPAPDPAAVAESASHPAMSAPGGSAVERVDTDVVDGAPPVTPALLFNVDTLKHATRVLREGAPWDAFAVPRPVRDSTGEVWQPTDPAGEEWQPVRDALAADEIATGQFRVVTPDGRSGDAGGHTEEFQITSRRPVQD